MKGLRPEKRVSQGLEGALTQIKGKNRGDLRGFVGTVVDNGLTERRG